MTPVLWHVVRAYGHDREAAGITGTTVYVDKGYHAMGMAPALVAG